MGAFSEVFSNAQISEAMNASASAPPPPTGPQLPAFMSSDMMLPPTVGPEYMRSPNWMNRAPEPMYPDAMALMPTYASPGYAEGRIAASIPLGPGTLGLGASGNMVNGKGAFTGADIQYSQGDNTYGLEYRTDPRSQAILGRFSTRF